PSADLHHQGGQNWMPIRGEFWTPIDRPIEASAWGNVAMQLIGLGLIENLAAARIVIEKSVDILNYYPQK
ncbi:hypothetical protein, partial [Rhizobium leguminosarum]|uniref:hypothetical protein n=1 Tax=Rhizobium leguminosarum TaxID=384 RepID=UPI003F9E5618